MLPEHDVRCRSAVEIHHLRRGAHPQHLHSAHHEPQTGGVRRFVDRGFQGVEAAYPRRLELDVGSAAGSEGHVDLFVVVEVEVAEGMLAIRVVAQDGGRGVQDGGLGRALEGHEERERGGAHLGGGHGEVLEGDDGAAADVYVDGVLGRGEVLPEAALTGFDGGGFAEEVVPHAAGKVGVHRGCVLVQDGRHEHRVAQHELVVVEPRLLVLWEGEEQGAHIRRARGVRLVHERVPEGQHAVAPVQHVRRRSGYGFPQEKLLVRRSAVGMGACERVESPHLNPPPT